MAPIPAPAPFRSRLALAAALALTACAPTPAPQTSPLAALSPVPAQPDSVTFLLPGALTTSAIFGPATRWGDARNLIVEYRLPGMQGQPLDTPLRIDRAAQWVADYAARYPQARINLFGYSTGGAIAIEAASRIANPARVRVAALSTATPFPGALMALLRAGPHLAAAALDEGSTNRARVWENYTVTLLLGPGWRQDPDRRVRGRAILAYWRNRLPPPTGEETRAQARDLLGWAAPSPRGAEIAFFHGGRDPVFPFWQIRALAGPLGATICRYPEGGHLLYLSDPEVIARIGHWFFDPAPAPPCGP